MKLQGGLMVCGTTSDAGKSFLVAGLCRLLARQGVRVAPFKAQNMANNASVTADGAEIGHAQWLQAVAAGVDPVSAMNPILLKPTSERTSQVVVRGRALGEMSADAYHRLKPDLRPLVLETLEELRAAFDVVICEGAGSPAEINLLDRDIVNLSLAEDADMPAIVVGDIDRGGVFASLYGTVALLPDALRSRVKGFVVNKLRGDPGLLGSACADLEERCGVPTLGVIPYVPGPDLDGEDSLTLDNQTTNTHGRQPSGTSLVGERPSSGATRSGYPSGATRPARDGGSFLASASEDVLDVVAIRWPMVANAGDMDPLRVEPAVKVRWVRSPAELGRPDLVVLPGSKATRSDLDWFRATGLAAAVQATGAPVVGICAGLQMCGTSIGDPDGVEGPPGTAPGLGWLPVTTTFEGDKVLDRPTGTVASGPGRGQQVAGYRIHHGRVRPLPLDGRPAAAGFPADADPRARVLAITWLTGDDGTPLGWHNVPQYRANQPSSRPDAPSRNATHLEDELPTADADPSRNDDSLGPSTSQLHMDQDHESCAPVDGRRQADIPAKGTTRDGLPNVEPTSEVLAAAEPSGFGTTLHAVFEDDGFRAAFLAWIAQQAGKAWSPAGVSFEAIRQDRLDRIASTLETHLDLDRLSEIITLGARGGETTSQKTGTEPLMAGETTPPHTAGTENPTSTQTAGAEETESIAT